MLQENILKGGRAHFLVALKAARQQVVNQGSGRVQGDDAAPIHHGYPVAQDFRLLHIMGGQHDGAALGFPFQRQFPHPAPRLRIQPGGGFVQKDDRRVVDQRGGDGEPLLLPAGQRAKRCGTLVGKVNGLQQRRRVHADAVDAAQQQQQFGKPQMLKKGAALQLDADNLLDGPGVFGHIKAGDGGRAAVRRAHPLNNFHRSSFAGAVGPQDGEHLAPRHAERHAVHRRHRAIAFAEFRGHDDRGRVGGVISAGAVGNGAGGVIAGRVIYRCRCRHRCQTAVDYSTCRVVCRR